MEHWEVHVTRAEKLDEASAELAAAVEKLRSGDDWATMLEVASRFHRYSANNVFLIMMQRPDATAVAGYGDWQKKFKRQVQKGEKGIKILAPCKYTTTDEETGEKVTRVRGFTVVRVFDVSQTEGEELKIIRPEVLVGEGVMGLWDGVAELIEARGYTVERGDTGSAYGFTHHEWKVVCVREDLDEAQATKTLIHELAHVMLHPSIVEYNEDRMRCEVEAESTAYLVGKLVGLETGDYSFPYVARWCKGDMDVVTAAANAAIKTARQIVGELGMGVAA